MGMNIQNNNQVYGTGSAFQWQELDGLSDAQQAQIQAGNYGTVQDAVVEGDKVLVKTDLGTMTFSGPQLDTPQQEPSQTGLQGVTSKLPSESNAVNMYAVLSLLFEAAQQQTDTARNIRETQLEDQAAQSKAAADDLRSGAGWALAGSIVSGVISIGSGALGAYQGAKMTGMASEMGTPGSTATEEEGIEMQNLGKSSEVSEAEATSSTSVEAQNMKIQAQIQAQYTKMQGWQGILNGVAGMAKGGGDFANQEYQADSKDKDALASEAQARYSQTNDLVSTSQKTVDTVQQSLQAIIESDDQTRRSILSRA